MAWAAFIALIPTLLIWLPFVFRLNSFWGIPLPTQGLATIVANYDGPLYLVVAKTLYNAAAIKANFQFPLPTEYYVAHFPLFPLLVALIGFVVNYPYAMLLVTLFSSVLAIYFFFLLIRKFVPEKEAFFITFVFSLFPARWLIVRSTGSADPLFVASIIASVLFFKDKKYWLSALWGAVATMTKSPGILLFISYFVYLIIPFIKNKISISGNKLLEKLNLKMTYPILLIPITLFLVFLFYYFVRGDFWAYFHSGDNIHLMFPPFSIFNYSASWVGTFWLEEVILIYLLGAIGVYRLFEKREYEIASFAAIFYFLTLFIAHRDLMRYSLPLVPFLFVAFADVLTRKEFKIAFAVIVIPIYLFTLAFISQNVMPVSNWAPFL